MVRGLVYYNEYDKEVAEWLRDLIGAGLLPQGVVDTRNITDVTADDLKGFNQCHFFAGIGGWALAISMAGLELEQGIWTGSCPCQPFSTAGIRKGVDDERHLWPEWFRLIRQCKPSKVFGEQVASAITYGWLDEVSNDLESEGYAIGSAVLPACSVGKHHKRERLFFVGNSEYARPYAAKRSSSNDTAVFDHKERAIGPGESSRAGDVSDVPEVSCVICPDGFKRIIEPSIDLLADGVSSRVVKLRALGNALVPELAAKFILAGV